MSPTKFIDLLHLNPTEMARILADMDASVRPGNTSRNRRRSVRIPYRQELILLCGLRNGAQQPTAYRVACVDLSKGGIGFLHGSFIHPGSVCTVTFINASRQGFRVIGEVKRCSHVSRHVHFVGVKFNEELAPELVTSLTQLEDAA